MLSSGIQQKEDGKYLLSLRKSSEMSQCVERRGRFRGFFVVVDEARRDSRESPERRF